MQQHKWAIPNPSVTVCLANRHKAKTFVENKSTRRKKERTVSAESATMDRTGDGTDGKRRRTSNARCKGRAAGERRATKRENGTGGRKRRADGARRNGKTIRRRKKRRAGSARRDGKSG